MRSNKAIASVCGVILFLYLLLHLFNFIFSGEIVHRRPLVECKQEDAIRSQLARPDSVTCEFVIDSTWNEEVPTITAYLQFFKWQSYINFSPFTWIDESPDLARLSISANCQDERSWAYQVENSTVKRELCACVYVDVDYQIQKKTVLLFIVDDGVWRKVGSVNFKW